jgi:hypothetical protein
MQHPIQQPPSGIIAIYIPESALKMVRLCALRLKPHEASVHGGTALSIRSTMLSTMKEPRQLNGRKSGYRVKVLYDLRVDVSAVCTACLMSALGQGTFYSLSVLTPAPSRHTLGKYS